MLLSIIVPVFNEELSLPTLISRLDSVRNTLSIDSEVIFVDNCSTDSSRRLLLERRENDKTYRYIRLSRNFGPSVESSLYAGYSHAKGDAIVVLYSDLQDPPELISELVNAWQQGYDVVHAVHTARLGESRIRRWLTRQYYSLVDRASSVEVPLNSGDFKLISRRVLMHLLAMKETSRYQRGLIPWIGFPHTQVHYQRESRRHGSSSTSWTAAIRTAITGLTSLSTAPLHWLTIAGFALSFFSFAGLLFYFGLFIAARTVPGVTTLVVLNLFTFGLVITALGVIGEYVARIYLETKNRPLFIIDENLSSY